MPDVVGPGPVIRERLARLAAEYEPQIDVAKAAVENAQGRERRRRAKELRKLEAVYKAARFAASGGPVVWSA